MSDREMLRDKYGEKIGELVFEDSKTTLRDRYGYKLGDYDSDTNLTRDTYGNFVGRGDLLAALLK
jgi:hypothetical protein